MCGRLSAIMSNTRMDIGDGVYADVIYIRDFARMIGRTVQTVRYLCFQGGFRRLKHIVDDRKRIYILKSELTQYPFMDGGKGRSVIYHYKDVGNALWERYVCMDCTTGEIKEGCLEARKMYGL